MNDDSSPDRNATTSAISSGIPGRFSRHLSRNLLRSSSVSRSTTLVWIMPGAMRDHAAGRGGFGNRLGGAGQPAARDVGQHQVRPLAGQLQRDRAAHRAAGAGHQRDASCQSRHFTLALTISRSLNFWILPEGVAGMLSRISSRSGMYCFASFCWFRNAIIDSKSSV